MPEKSCVARGNCEVDRLAGMRINQYFASVPKIAEIAIANLSGKPARKSKPPGTRHKADIQETIH